jgi:multidrug efflux pump subunit AcrA (membrane-fusion protein)
VNFVSPRIDTANQLLLVKAPVPNPDHRFRNDQVLHARVVWKQLDKPMVPVTAMTRLGAQSFVFVWAAARPEQPRSRSPSNLAR